MLEVFLFTIMSFLKSSREFKFDQLNLIINCACLLLLESRSMICFSRSKRSKLQSWQCNLFVFVIFFCGCSCCQDITLWVNFFLLPEKAFMHIRPKAKKKEEERLKREEEERLKTEEEERLKNEEGPTNLRTNQPHRRRSSFQIIA